MSDKRIEKEYDEIKVDKTGGFQIKKKGLKHYQCRLDGPMDSPYQEGHFFIDIKIPVNYPFSPPLMQFITKIWHPNISSVTGAICLDILKSEWTPALTIRTALLSIQALLSAPEPNDPQDAMVAQQYKSNYREFEKKAKNWVETFAKVKDFAADKEVKEVQKLMEMGFDRELALSTLEKNDWDVQKSLEVL
ncbi:hypothetical protein MHBO_002659 [Bonamia ostreae]|uniref:E2 ubiquitin-conjugating enzyme n=1 Tax=Bonamia ostreae TaxID=126728 RepID=A0ABV2AN24_9EUKA